FARPDARSACGTAARPVAPVRSGRRDTNFARHAMPAWPAPPEGGYVGRRLEEVRHALWRARDLPWVDPQQVFLVGHSLGRGTAGMWPTRDVTAVAILGQDCRSGQAIAGFEMPISVPVLPLLDRRDPWRGDRARELSCGELAMRADLSGVAVGSDRGRPDAPVAQDTLLRFLLGGATRT
uniref:hypothetical protein n=1 Tax=Falsiroseomonas oryzae TaxID=2766473 RepID=UPI0022EB80BF